jgi:hypothetical protein
MVLISLLSRIINDMLNKPLSLLAHVLNDRIVEFDSRFFRSLNAGFEIHLVIPKVSIDASAPGFMIFNMVAYFVTSKVFEFGGDVVR